MRFTVQDGIWLLIIGAMAIVWWADHGLLADQVKALRATVAHLERQVKQDFERKNP
jgi:hypothetical protein